MGRAGRVSATSLIGDSEPLKRNRSDEIQTDAAGNLRSKERVRSGAKFMTEDVALEGKSVLHLKGKMLHFKGRGVAPQGKKRCTSREGMLHFEGNSFCRSSLNSMFCGRFLLFPHSYTVLHIINNKGVLLQ